jgi:hypothetical protein
MWPVAQQYPCKNLRGNWTYGQLLSNFRAFYATSMFTEIFRTAPVLAPLSPIPVHILVISVFNGSINILVLFTPRIS